MRTLTTVSVAAMAIALPSPLPRLRRRRRPRGRRGARPASSPTATAGDDERRYDDHAILSSGPALPHLVNSDAFDPVARLYRAGESEPVAENDDSDGSLNSRIVYSPAASGDFVLRVSAFAADGRGAYTARLASLPPLPPAVPCPGRSPAGSRTGDGAERGAEGRRYDEYSLRLEAGRRYRLFGRMPAPSIRSPASTAPAPTRSSPRMTTAAERSIRSSPTARPRAAIMCSPSSPSSPTAAAPIAPRPRSTPPLPPPVSTPLPAHGGDGAGASGRARWPRPTRLRRHAASTIIWSTSTPARSGYISLEGAGFDTLVQVLVPAERGKDSPAILEQDDDTGAGLNSLLVFAPEEAGDYIVRVTLGGRQHRRLPALGQPIGLGTAPGDSH